MFVVCLSVYAVKGKKKKKTDISIVTSYKINILN